MGKELFDYQVAVIGAGFGGLGMAIKLKQSGRKNFVILEKASELGGTWRDNVYPGCACDIPSHLYSFSFELNPNWSRQFSPQPEILSYLQSCAEKHGLNEHIRFNAEVNEMKFLPEKGGWRISLANGESITVQSVVLATGPLNRINIPEIPGRESFKGPAFHSSQWDTNAQWEGKRVGIIGTGASAIQLVPEIADRVEKLYVFQRTPPWIIPKPDRKIGKFEQGLYRLFPPLQRLHRNWIFFRLDAVVGGFLGNKFLNNVTKNVALKHIRKSLSDPQLKEWVTPNYTPGCKRILVSNEYYPALEKEQVELIPEGVSEISHNKLFTPSGKEREVDCLVYATGFNVADVFTFIKIYGKNGQELHDYWEEVGISAYKGTAISGFPHLFMLLGPNTGLGHNSVVDIEESQFSYVLDNLDHIERLKSGFLELKMEVQQAYNEEIQERLKSTVWQSGGCKSWYQNEVGENPTIWPGSNRAFRRETRKVDISDYDLVKPEKIPT